MVLHLAGHVPDHSFETKKLSPVKPKSQTIVILDILVSGGSIGVLFIRMAFIQNGHGHPKAADGSTCDVGVSG